MPPFRKRLGELLVESRVITGTQLQEALAYQKESGQRLGQALISIGFVSEQDIMNVLQFQLGIPQVDLVANEPPTELMHLIPENVARRYQAVAVSRKGNMLRVAMVDPLNASAVEDLAKATGCEIEAAIAREEDIDNLLGKAYSFTELDDSELQQLGDEVSGNRDKIALDVDAANAGPVVRVANTLIQQAIASRASDVHLEPQEDGLHVRFRIDGVLREMMKMPRNVHPPLASRIKIMAKMDISEKRLPQDGRIQISLQDRDVDIRVSSMPSVFGEKIVMRILDKGILLFSLDQLGFDSQVLERYRRLIRQAFGMVLMVGPTGSGKTTTLYGSLNEIKDAEKNIVTIEDPVEYVFPGITQVSVFPKAGLTFAVGLRAILRQDPDMIMVGEIRDTETAEIAVRAANTGHFVFSTLHTNNAAGTITQLLDMDIPPFLVASSITGIMAQRLVRIICPNCKETYEVPEGAPERAFLGVPPDKPLTLHRGKGCLACDGTGYHGRAALEELMIMNSDLRRLVMQRADSQAIRQLAIEQGMVPLIQSGINKILAGTTTLQEVMRVAYALED